jgi:hypothetical protein
MDGAASADSGMDRVIEAYKRDIDRTLLRENLRLSPEERLRKLAAFVRLADELHQRFSPKT